MRAVRYKFLVIIILLLLIVGFIAFRWWQGPVVAVYQVETAPLIQNVVASGQVETVSRAQIGSEITGVVLERFVKEGDKIKKGDVLFTLKSDEIQAQVRQIEAQLKELESSKRPQANVELATAKLQLDQSRREANRRRNALSGVFSAEEIEKAVQAEKQAENVYETARLKAQTYASGQVEELKLKEQLASLKAQLDKTKVISEVTGTILTRHVESGDLVQPGTTLFTIALDGDTQVRVPLDERNLPRLALNQNAVIIADAYPDQPFPAKINFIAPSIDSERGTVEVRLAINEIPHFLRQDMTVSVNIETGKRQKAIIIANDALFNIQGDTAQVRIVRNNQIEQQKIRLGLRGLAQSEVLSGLKEGDLVVANTQLNLSNGERVRVQKQTQLTDQVVRTN